MKREEEIQNYAYNNCINDDVDDTSYSLIVETAKWADETMIEKARKWLENRHNIEKYLGILTSKTVDLANAFVKAMEE